MAKKSEDKAPVDDSLPSVGQVKVRQHEVNDRFEYDVAFRMGFVGVGQGGGRIAETFYKMGYGRVGVVNTAKADLDEVDDAIIKLDLATGGAGKDPEYGAASINGKDELVWDLFTRALGKQCEYLLVCASLGGGTGSGASTKVLEVARKYMEECGADPSRVGMIVSLPDPHEGHTVCRNAVYAFERLYKMAPSPMVIIDNRRIGEIYDNPGVLQFYPLCNSQVAKLFHLFNRLAVQRTKLMTFDRADFATLLDAGIIAFGASQIDQYNSGADISEAIRGQLANTLLAPVDLSKGKRAGCIFVGGTKVLEEIPMEFFGGGFDMLNRMLAEGSMVHRGIYEGTSPDLRCYTMIADLPPPTQRLHQLAAKGSVPVEGLAKFLGVQD
jgi:cell division GTPase FtsZ